MCDLHKKMYVEACAKPLQGIDNPEHADEFWRPSLADHINHARFALAYDDVRKKPVLSDKQDQQRQLLRQKLQRK